MPLERVHASDSAKLRAMSLGMRMSNPSVACVVYLQVDGLMESRKRIQVLTCATHEPDARSTLEPSTDFAPKYPWAQIAIVARCGNVFVKP